MAPLTEIVAFFEKKIQGAFWRFSGQKRALSDSKHLATLLEFVFSYAHWSNFSKSTTLWKKNYIFFFFDALNLGQIVLKKIDSKLTQSLDILILYFFYEYLFDFYTLGPFFGLSSSYSLKDLDNTKYFFIVVV